MENEINKACINCKRIIDEKTFYSSKTCDYCEE